LKFADFKKRLNATSKKNSGRTDSSWAERAEKARPTAHPGRVKGKKGWLTGGARPSVPVLNEGVSWYSGRWIKRGSNGRRPSPSTDAYTWEQLG
jgi:hypothetical protein